MGSRETGHARVYRWLLRLYPSPFRGRFADDMGPNLAPFVGTMAIAIAVAAALAGCVGSAPAGFSNVPTSTPSATGGTARAELRRIIEDVEGATASRYGSRDDRGNELDGIKIIAAPEIGGFVGVSHSFHDPPGIYVVNLATSTNLMDWTWRVELAQQASMPTIRPASDAGYVVAWEQEPHNHLAFAHYASWAELLAGSRAKTFEVPNSLSICAEGTPNLYQASSTFLDVGFHFYDGCELDRQARGTTDWSTWTASRQPSLEAAVREHGVQGGVGDRDVIDFRGSELTLIEGQAVLGDWRTWNIYLHDAATGDAEGLTFRTDAGSSAFTNPTIEAIEIEGQPAILVTLFVPQEGAHGGEAGELICYRILDASAAE